MSPQIQVVLIAGGCTGAVGLLGLGVMRLLRRASLRLSLQVGSTVAVLAIVAGTLATAETMFISPHDLGVVVMICVVAGLAAFGFCWLLGRQVGTTMVPVEDDAALLTCGYPLLGIGWVSNTAGHSRGGSSPSRTHPYVHAGSPCTWPGSVALAPPAGHLHIRLIDEPAVSRHVTAQASSLDELGSKPLDPAIDRDVVHGDTVLGQQLLNVRVGQAVPLVPADRDRDHLPRKAEASKH